MTKIFEESAVTIDALDAHLRDSGLVPYDVQPDVIRLRSEKGIAYRVFLIPDRKFIRFATYLPLNRQAPVERKHELARRLNEDVFLPVFTIDIDGDLAVSYVLPFGGGGLIAGNFMSIVNRFASLLEFVAETYNSDGLIDFGAPTTVPAVADAVSAPSDGELLH
ncbi:YbjN domain-containing protein [Burkholderia pseudomallei]|uniref:YbjN domain-containing protein n=1 Tax=Burkholderia pseudomallei TaxID=28450 RepID=UPI0021F78DC2|nr:YbjN domain-containing protein [Burkholderia pseudomallei]MCV9980954.1 YbjN domain-containing protein [Burkholderia pseudomallei]MCV9987148.1 YbjN domain-containing protein [Burkholderia pseudomallei]MCW0030171.1 YbjN domain-containing protein [Burkholderia pseudomallei]MCW0091333.1 YbjN domain-containing protein [Burkholderia pseudomallei]MCW0105880.1 YbjN domain-containing protein [Burkholderia pseudomallei]